MSIGFSLGTTLNAKVLIFAWLFRLRQISCNIKMFMQVLSVLQAATTVAARKQRPESQERTALCFEVGLKASFWLITAINPRAVSSACAIPILPFATAFGNFFSISVHQSQRRACLYFKTVFPFNAICCYSESIPAVSQEDRTLLHNERGSPNHNFTFHSSVLLCKERMWTSPLWENPGAASESKAHISSH